MLNTGMLKIIDAQETPIVPGASIPAEGLPLVRELVNGHECVRMGNETKAPFMGFSYSESLTPRVKARIEVLLANPETGEVVLTNEPIVGQISFYDADGKPITTATVDGKVATIEDQKGKMVKVQYRYQPSMEEVMTTDRVLIPFMAASELTESVGVILEGVVYTDMYEASVDFNDVNIKLAVSTNGLVTKQDESGSLAEINGVVISVPGIDTPFLGIRLGY